MFLRIAPVILMIATVLSTGCVGNLADANLSDAYLPLPHAIDLNTASLKELQKIPHVGESLAQKIIHHREIHGRFRRAEHLMLIQGISDKRFRKIRPLVRVE